MTAHTFAQTLTSVRQTLGRYTWWLSFSLVLVVAVLAAYRSPPLPNISAPIMRSTQVAPLNPALQSVVDCLRTHSSDQPLLAPAGPLDPATQSALDYIHAHSNDQPQCAAASWNQATQDVLDYLRAHSR